MEIKEFPTRAESKMEEAEKDELIGRLKRESQNFQEENRKLRDTISFMAKELIRSRDELITQMNYILILDRNDFESKG